MRVETTGIFNRINHITKAPLIRKNTGQDHLNRTLIRGRKFTATNAAKRATGVKIVQKTNKSTTSTLHPQ
jgi:hypothetical protein